MSKPLVAIVKPNDQKRLYGELSAFALTAIEPPLWTALLGGYLRSLGYQVELLDAEIEGWDGPATATRIKALNPFLTVVSVSGSNPSASTMNMIGANQILRSLREQAPTLKTALHGLHPTALPARTMKEEPIDFLCQGEGFYTLPALLEALQTQWPDFHIPGLWYRENGNICSNPPALIFGNLDNLPMPAWDLLPMTRYRAHNWHCFGNINARQPYGVIYTSLGCPFDCKFCCINALFGNPGIRVRSPALVVEEIDFLVSKYGIRNIKIIDELFALNEARVIDICDRIIERGYDLNMWAYARVNTLTPRMLAHMKQAGIHWVAIGFESANERVLKNVHKSYEIKSTMKVVESVYQEGLYLLSNFIMGLPEDDFDSMQQTLNLAMDMNAEWLNIYAAAAYPGSRLYDEAISSGWSLPKTWAGYSPYARDSLPLPTKHLTAGEVLSFRDYAFHAYNENPRYLDKIRHQFGIETVRHIQNMTQHRLTRDCRQFAHEEH